MPSIEPLSPTERELLLGLARAALEAAAGGADSYYVDATLRRGRLAEQGASFVTLKKRGDLRGCIGTLEPHRALVDDVAANAIASATRDPRFAPVRTDELAAIHISLSVLSPRVEMEFSSEADLLARIRPGVDGLVLIDRGHRGTFLPSVWEQLPTVDSFWLHLKVKAGLPVSHWSETLRVQRYEAEVFGD